jgi:hypothetical protein
MKAVKLKEKIRLRISLFYLPHRSKYTSPAHLYAEGGSAGGLLMGLF